jgi:hypothetical protein
LREGAHDYNGSASPNLTEPVAEYSHQEGGCSVTGGYVYRGSMLEWNGIYLYGDYCTGLIWGLIHSGNTWQKQQLFDVDFTITSFGQDENGAWRKSKFLQVLSIIGGLSPESMTPVTGRRLFVALQ